MVVRYWIVVASKEHAMMGASSGFAMAGHGKRSGLARMHKGDKIVYYSPKVEFGGDEPLHAFTALGEVEDEEIYQVEMSPDFKPFRRKVRYAKTGEVKIVPLIRDLDFIKNKKLWGSVFRLGLVEIPEPDFKRISDAFDALP
jgi:hypothetical protein